MVQFLSSLALLLLVSGCSSKQEFEPKSVESSVDYLSSGESIESVSGSIATLKSGKVILKDGTALESQKFGRVLEIDEESSLEIKDKSIFFQNREIELPNRVVTASGDNSRVAYVLSNGDIGVFSLDENKTVFKEKFQSVDTIDNRLPKPIFDGNTLLFFTLNGKLAVFNLEHNTIAREFSVGSSVDYGNIIDANMEKTYLYLLTQNEIVRISEFGELRKKFSIRGAIWRGENIYLIEKDGAIQKLDQELNSVASIKFPFAYFKNWGVFKEKIYLIESNGYFVKVDMSLENYKVFESNIDEEKCFFGGDRFICDRKIVKLPL